MRFFNIWRERMWVEVNTTFLIVLCVLAVLFIPNIVFAADSSCTVPMTKLQWVGTTDLKLGDNDPRVCHLQVFLNRLGYRVAPEGVSESAIFTPGVEGGLRHYQRGRNIIETGVFDRGTRGSILGNTTVLPAPTVEPGVCYTDNTNISFCDIVWTRPTGIDTKGNIYYDFVDYYQLRFWNNNSCDGLYEKDERIGKIFTIAGLTSPGVSSGKTSYRVDHTTPVSFKVRGIKENFLGQFVGPIPGEWSGCITTTVQNAQVAPRIPVIAEPAVYVAKSLRGDRHLVSMLWTAITDANAYHIILYGDHNCVSDGDRGYPKTFPYDGKNFSPFGIHKRHKYILGSPLTNTKPIKRSFQVRASLDGGKEETSECVNYELPIAMSIPAPENVTAAVGVDAGQIRYQANISWDPIKVVSAAGSKGGYRMTLYQDHGCTGSVMPNTQTNKNYFYSADNKKSFRYSFREYPINRSFRIRGVVSGSEGNISECVDYIVPAIGANIPAAKNVTAVVDLNDSQDRYVTTISWEPVVIVSAAEDKGGYRITIYRDHGCTGSVMPNTQTNKNYFYSADNKKSFRYSFREYPINRSFRIRGVVSGSEGNISECIDYTIPASTTESKPTGATEPEETKPLAKPTNLQLNSTTGELTWDAVSGADRYEVQPYLGQDCAGIALATIDTGDESSTTSPILTTGNLSLKVRVFPGEILSDECVNTTAPGLPEPPAEEEETPPPDTTPPTVSFSPEDGAVITDADTNIVLTFSEPIHRNNTNAPFSNTNIKRIITLKEGGSSGKDIRYTATLNDDNTTVTLDPNNPPPEGTIYVAVSDNYYDAVGNQGVPSHSLFTIDTTPPVITLNGESSMTITEGDSFTDPGATTDDGEQVITQGTVNTATAGTYTITYTATDAAGNTATATREVVVEPTPPGLPEPPAEEEETPPPDTTPPTVSFSPEDGAVITDADTNIVLTFSEPIHRNNTNAPFSNTNIKRIITLKEGGSSGKDIRYTATLNDDNTTVTLDPNNPPPEGTIYVAVSDNYYDAVGNQGVPSHSLFTIDTTPPVITLNGESSMTITEGDSFTDPGATTDDGEQVITQGTVNTATAGTYTITYTATDAAGNTATKTRNVIVEPVPNPPSEPVRFSIEYFKSTDGQYLAGNNLEYRRYHLRVLPFENKNIFNNRNWLNLYANENCLENHNNFGGTITSDLIASPEPSNTYSSFSPLPRSLQFFTLGPYPISECIILPPAEEYTEQIQYIHGTLFAEDSIDVFLPIDTSEKPEGFVVAYESDKKEAVLEWDLVSYATRYWIEEYIGNLDINPDGDFVGQDCQGPSQPIGIKKTGTGEHVASFLRRGTVETVTKNQNRIQVTTQPSSPLYSYRVYALGPDGRGGTQRSRFSECVNVDENAVVPERTVESYATFSLIYKKDNCDLCRRARYQFNIERQSGEYSRGYKAELHTSDNCESPEPSLLLVRDNDLKTAIFGIDFLPRYKSLQILFDTRAALYPITECVTLPAANDYGYAEQRLPIPLLTTIDSTNTDSVTETPLTNTDSENIIEKIIDTAVDTLTDVICAVPLIDNLCPDESAGDTDTTPTNPPTQTDKPTNLQLNSTTGELTWDAVSGADRYEVQPYLGQDCAGIALATIDTGDESSTTSPILTTGNLSLKVRVFPGEILSDECVNTTAPGLPEPPAEEEETPPPDTTPPTVSFSPEDGAVITDADTNIVLTFSEPIHRNNTNAPFSNTNIKRIITLKEGGSSGKDIRYTATLNDDNTTVTLDPNNPPPEGTIYVAVSDNYYDAVGNQGVPSHSLFTIDTTPPVITLNGESSMTITEGDSFTDPGATTDDGEQVITQGTVNTATAGTYTITYTATDAAGNTATATREVVVEPTPPGLPEPPAEEEEIPPVEIECADTETCVSITYDDDSNKLNIGDEFTVAVNIHGGVGVKGYQMEVIYDTNILQYVSDAVGDYLPDVLFRAPIGSSPHDGRMGLSTMSSGEASNGDGVLETITFKVLKKQKTSLTLSNVIISDGDTLEIDRIYDTLVLFGNSAAQEIDVTEW